MMREKTTADKGFMSGGPMYILGDLRFYIVFA